jgi:hypothetical protein
MHTWTTDFNGYDVRRIMQSAVFAAETVLLPANAQIAPGLADAARNDVARQLGRLRDLGAVELWALEDDLPDRPLVPGAPTTVIPVEDYADLYQEAIESLVMQRRDFLGDQHALHFDGMTEIILGKHATIHAVLCRYLSAGAVLHDAASATGYGQFLLQLQAEAVLSDVIGEIAMQLGLPDVSDFPDEILSAARANLQPFRNRVLAQLMRGGVMAGPQGERWVKELVARHVIAEYQLLREREKATHTTPARRGVWRMKRMIRRSKRSTSEPLQMLLELDRVLDQ